MSEQSEPRKSRISEFSNIEEEAEFWDTHDTAEFEDEFKPVQVRFAKNLSEGFKVCFDRKQQGKPGKSKAPHSLLETSGCGILRAASNGMEPVVESQQPAMINRKPAMMVIVNGSWSIVTPRSTATAGLT